MICINCGEQYIGETGNELKTRMVVHRQQIRTENLRVLKVSKHIFTCGKGFKVFPFSKMFSSASSLDRKLKEQYFINVFKPELNA